MHLSIEARGGNGERLWTKDWINVAGVAGVREHASAVVQARRHRPRLVHEGEIFSYDESTTL